MIVYDMICCCMYPAPRPPPDRPSPHPTPSAHLPAPPSTSDDDDDGPRPLEWRVASCRTRGSVGVCVLAKNCSDFLEILGHCNDERGRSDLPDKACISVGIFVLTEQSSDILKFLTNSSWEVSRHGGVNKQRYFHEGGGVVLTHGPSDHYRTHLIGRHPLVSDTVPFGVWFPVQRSPPQKPISTYSCFWHDVPVDVGHSQGERWQTYLSGIFILGEI